MEIIKVELLMGKTASGQLQLRYPDVHTLFASHTNRLPTLRFFSQNEKIFPNAHTDTIGALVPQGISREPDGTEHHSRCPLQAIKLSLTPHTSPISTKTSSRTALLFASCYYKLCCLIFQHLPGTFLLSKWPSLHSWRFGSTMVVRQ